MVVEFFNIYYFLFIVIAIILLLVIYNILKNKDNTTKYNTLLIIAFLNLGLHFMKLLFSPYNSNYPISIRKVTFENICAVSTLVLPWIMLYKKSKVLNNYFSFISFFGGLGALLVPTEALGKNPFIFDVIRFYTCHFVLLSIPLLAMMLKLFKPNYKQALICPLMFLFVELIILINEVCLIKVGLVSNNISDFLNRDIRNSSLIFGPLPAMDSFDQFILIFVPDIFTKNIFGIEGVGDFYWPIIWLIIPSLIYLPISFILFSLPTNYDDIVKDLKVKRRKKYELFSDRK